jgi:hypothetical protein
MVGKKGFMRVVEAVVAILIIFGVLLLIASKTRTGQENNLGGILRPILNEVAHNSTLRQEIIENSSDVLININNMVGKRLNNPALNYSVLICELNDVCSFGSVMNNKDMFASERIISSTINEADFNPKKVKIYLWRKSAA